MGDHARWSILDLLGRLKGSDETSFVHESSSPSFPAPFIAQDFPTTGERKLIERELIEGVVIGMARLDFDDPTVVHMTISEHENDVQSDKATAGSVDHSDLSPGSASTSTSTPSLTSTFNSDSSGDPDTNYVFGNSQNTVLGQSISSKDGSRLNILTPLPNTPINSSVATSPAPYISTQETRIRVSFSEPVTTSSDIDTDSDTVQEFDDAAADTDAETVNSVLDQREFSGEEGFFEGDSDASEEAAIGRVASMSLIAAVTASGRSDSF